jgi:hypothetical protein
MVGKLSLEARLLRALGFLANSHSIKCYISLIYYPGLAQRTMYGVITKGPSLIHLTN